MVGAGGAVVKTGIGVTILGKNEEAVNYLMIGKTHTYRIYRRDPTREVASARPGSAGLARQVSADGKGGGERGNGYPALIGVFHS